MSKREFSKKTASIEVRMAPEVKNDFMRLCRERKLSASALIRGFIEQYIDVANRTPQSKIYKEFDMIKILKSSRARLAAVGACLVAGVSVATPTAAADSRLEAVFEWLDANHDKSITPTEFIAPDRVQAPRFTGIEIVVTTKGEHRAGESRTDLFHRIDENGDGEVSLRELDGVVRVDTILKEPILSADQNGDGGVTAVELAAHITARRAMAGEADPAGGAALMAQGLIAAHDDNRDGSVGPEDFKKSQ